MAVDGSGFEPNDRQRERVGTLIGVVQILQNLTDASSLGKAMAVAVTATFYGIFGANFLFLPVAGKLNDRQIVDGPHPPGDEQRQAAGNRFAHRYTERLEGRHQDERVGLRIGLR